MQKIVVYSEAVGNVYELIAAASAQGAPVVAVAVADESEVVELAKTGVEKVLRIDPVDGAPAEAYGTAVAEAARVEGADVVYVSASARGRSVAGIIAQTLGAPCAAEARAVDRSDGITVTRTIYGGKVNAIEKTTAPVTVITIPMRSVAPAVADKAVAPIETLACDAASYGVKVTGVVPKEGDNVDVTLASTIVCAGRGIAKKDDMYLAHDLAEALGGVVGCSRPAACDLDYLPRDRYIGLSGKQVKPKLFVGVGVAGQIQLMAGANDSKVIVAINKDENAPVKDYSDYFIPADLYDVVPALTNAIKAL